MQLLFAYAAAGQQWLPIYVPRRPGSPGPGSNAAVAALRGFRYLGRTAPVLRARSSAG
jgi:hypothetical protein